MSNVIVTSVSNNTLRNKLAKLQNSCNITCINGSREVIAYVFHGKQQYKFKMKKTRKHHLKVVPPGKAFRGVTSHFDYVGVEEHRYCRNKSLIVKIVRSLKKADLWQHIENPDFFVANEFNARMDKKKVLEEREVLLG